MSKIALQLYTLKGEFEKDPRGILKKVAEMGYEGVEFYGNYAGLSMKELREELDRNGLKAAGAVVEMEKLTDEAKLTQAIKDCGILGTDVIVCPWINDDQRDSAESCRRTAEALDRAGKFCREHGIRFLYHVHGYEFIDYGGTNLMEILLQETDPASFNLEVDVYWVEYGGQDAMQFLLKNWGRTVYIHLKDMRDRETKHDIEVGDGLIDMRGVIGLAARRGCQWVIVEQEAFDMPVLDSAAKSYKNIRAILAGIEEGPRFKKQVIGRLENINADSPMNTFCTVGDFNGDGFPDFVACGRNGRMAWFENPGREDAEWKMHVIGEPNHMECGGCAIDLGRGFTDIINGADYADDGVYWFENPGKPDAEWKKHIIARTGCGQFHDTMVVYAKNDGKKYLVFTNQLCPGGTTIYCVPLPKDPMVSPWPGLEVVAEGKFLPNPRHPWNGEGVQSEEGLAFGDVDNDGKGEIVCGTHWYKFNEGRWEEHRFTDKYYITAKVAIGDIDGDGKNEIVLSEGDAYIYGYKEGGKLAWFKPEGEVTGLWTEHLIETGLLDGHSLHAADLCGNGSLDILVGEIGVISGICEDYVVREPRIMIYENDGKGNFPRRHTIDTGTGTHEAVLVDLLNRGRLDLIGKPLHGPEQWNIHVWFNQGS